MAFHAGQYVDIRIPGTERTRAFSMANTSESDHRLEFMIKIYPGGHFSGLLSDRLKPGDRLEVRGPFGVFMMREHSDADLVFIRGGAGRAPIWSLLNSMAERRIDRNVSHYYGARTRRDRLYLDEIEALPERLKDFRVVPALSEPSSEDEWDRETGFIHDVVDRLEGDLTGHEGYLCGPPPMIDAAYRCSPRTEFPRRGSSMTSSRSRLQRRRRTPHTSERQGGARASKGSVTSAGSGHGIHRGV
jgi:propane monooxygenase reductase subunit